MAVGIRRGNEGGDDGAGQQPNTDQGTKEERGGRSDRRGRGPKTMRERRLAATRATPTRPLTIPSRQPAWVTASPPIRPRRQWARRWAPFPERDRPLPAMCERLSPAVRPRRDPCERPDGTATSRGEPPIVPHSRRNRSITHILPEQLLSYVDVAWGTASEERRGNPSFWVLET